jgi:2,5-dichloro-2,5-cyclohexadiene-1,4-diol dehydrogenase 1
VTLEGKVIIVTGGGSGIGEATASILSGAGAAVLVADCDLAGAEQTSERISQNGGTAYALKVDVAREEQVAAMVSETVRRWGRLDGAFNNAGVKMHSKPTHELSSEEWHRVMTINLDSVFYCMKYEIQAMRDTGGSIVNNSSMNGTVAIPMATEYTASKHAVLGATRGAASEARLTGVRVNAVLPGLIETPMISDLVHNPGFKTHFDSALARHTIGRFGRPEDVAYAVKWLLSDESTFINGAAIAVDGGYTAS